MCSQEQAPSLTHFSLQCCSVPDHWQGLSFTRAEGSKHLLPPTHLLLTLWVEGLLGHCPLTDIGCLTVFVRRVLVFISTPLLISLLFTESANDRQPSQTHAAVPKAYRAWE